MNYDHDAIYKAYPNEQLEIIDGKGIFKSDTSCSESFSVDQSRVDAARVELNKLTYQNDRVTGIGSTSGYDPITEQLDQLYHDMKNGTLNTSGQWYVGITSVKTNIPKPS